MSAAGKVIITCAVTGSIHTPSMSPHAHLRNGDRRKSAWRGRGWSSYRPLARLRSFLTSGRQTERNVAYFMRATNPDKSNV